MDAWRRRVTTAEAGLRLDRYLHQFHSDTTRSQIKRWIEQERALVNGAPTKAGHPLKAGETVTLAEAPAPAPLPEGEDIPLDIVYEDEDLLVVDKPPGMVVHPGAGVDSGTLVHALLGRGTTLSSLGAPLRPGIVHRLDKGTSGLLVVAKTDAAHRGLSEDLAQRTVVRRYIAMVWGRPRTERGRVAAALARSRADRRRMRVVSRGGREAATRYRMLAAQSPVSLLVLALETGRTHQIRAHFKHLGCPVFGDPEYAGRSPRGRALTAREREAVRGALAALPRQALHAARLGFRHPRKEKALEFTSPLPEDIRKAGACLGLPPEVMVSGVKEDV